MSCLKQKKIKQIHISDEGLIPIDQLKNFIIETIKDKSESSSKFSPIYDNLKMYEGYQPPKFNNLMAKEIPKEHIAHCTETCNAVGTYDDYLVKEFV